MGGRQRVVLCVCDQRLDQAFFDGAGFDGIAGGVPMILFCQ